MHTHKIEHIFYQNFHYQFTFIERVSTAHNMYELLLFPGVADAKLTLPEKDFDLLQIVNIN
jgi:hypothetical protein